MTLSGAPPVPVGMVLAHIGTLVTCRWRGRRQGELETIPNGALAWADDTIVWVGSERDLPVPYRDWPRVDAGGRMVIPGLVDCHTHLAFGGWRVDEFVARLEGASYREIQRKGGGILSTVRATRLATDEMLHAKARDLLDGMLRHGVTTVEAKSGYGLDAETELRLLRCYQALAAETGRPVVPTFLGAHTVPPEFAGNRDGYVRLLIDEMIPRVARDGLARFVDVFVEDGAFTVSEARAILQASASAGLGRKLHVDQLRPGGGAELAAAVGAISADHLEHVSPGGIQALAAAGTVAVSLPVASLTLGQPPLPARRLMDAGVPVAVATDFNPGTAPVANLPLACYLATVFQRMTPAEVLHGATIVAARAIGLEHTLGSLEPGKRADILVLDVEGVEEWLYRFERDRPSLIVAGGRKK